MKRAVGKNKKLESFKLESLKLESFSSSWRVSFEIGKFLCSWKAPAVEKFQSKSNDLLLMRDRPYNYVKNSFGRKMDGIESNWVMICFKVQNDGGQSTCIEVKWSV